MKHRRRHGSNKKKREGFSFFGWLLLGASALVTLHVFKSYDVATVNDVADASIVQKKKEENVKKMSLGGGSRPQDYEKEKAYYANVALAWRSLQRF
jgi:hypothetical protein